ncbi:hypothetical protein N0V90_012777 [Kalmusia sp. IMI 367209]|nr:hypothetical protein N0V90_012777 [Kalmusia sp. IMI 367209]
MPVSEIPVIIGVGDIKNRSSAAKEPAVLIQEAITAALKDTSASDLLQLQSSIDSIAVVKTWTWPYPDLPGLLASKIGVKPKHSFYSEHGGDKPGKLFDEAAKRIARGEYLGALHDIGTPIHVYPLYENAFRAQRSQSLRENNEESSKLYAEFSKIASENEVAWFQGKYNDEKTIGTLGKKNRMICSPYPLLMNAFNTVNLAAACILTSTSYARSLGVPESKWVYPLSGAGTSDAASFWLRPNFYTSPSISRSLDTALSLAHLSASDIDLFDIYSCFPIVPKLVAHHLGLPITGGQKQLTLLGGLTSFGGAGNNYSMHALTAMTRAIREGKGSNGLVLCNGGVLSYQHVVILSKGPRKEGVYPQENPLPNEITDVKVPGIVEHPQVEATVETYTVEFNRDGTPLRGYIVGRLKRNDERFIANHGDDSTLRQMASGTGEIVGKSGWVRQDSERKGRALFSFDEHSRI